MSIITSNELFINMKNIPSRDSEEYKAFFKEEKRKCEEGVTIGGVYISGWLYWHINHWKIQGDDDKGGRPMITPRLRDNEWMIAEAIHRAETARKGLCIFGARQISKSVFASSYSARKATLIKNSQNVIVGGSKPDLNNITQYIDFGMQNVTPYFRIPRITRDWTKPEVYLGVKTKEGDNKIHSSFRIRNTEGGKNTEAVAGATTSSILFDEIGKGDFIQAYESAKPSLLGDFGWRCSPILTGTGGAFEKGRDAEIMFFNPDSNDIIAFIDENTNKKTGLFMPGWLRQDFKKKTNLAEYLGVEDPELENIPIMASDKERGIETLKDERLALAKDPDGSKLLKKIMYYPLEVDEIFLTEGENIFPKDLLIDQKQFLAKYAPPVDYVELYLDANNEVKHKFTEKKPIMHYPSRPEDNREGVIQIWEMPISNAPNTIYVAATDPYKQSEAAYSDSVGSTYVFKRTYDIVSDKFQNMIVAAYHGRPKNIHTWYQNTKLLLKFYNAKTLCENMDFGFIQHLIDKNEAPFFLVPQPQFLYDIHPNTTVNRNYGIHMTTEIKNYIHTCIIEYMTSTISVDLKDDGTKKEVLGVRRIIDPLLLEELLKFSSTANVDRIISFGLVLAYAKSLDKNPIKTQKDSRYEELYRGSSGRSKNPFKGSMNPFRKIS